MKVLVIQTVSSHIVSYSQYSIPVNIEWTVRNGHSYFLYRNDNFPYHPAWLKLEAFNHVRYQDYDYVWVLDADCVINNGNVTLKQIIGDDKAEIIASANGRNGGRLINSGSIIYRTGVIPILLEKWDQCRLEKRPILTEHFWDQELINDWYEEDSSRFSIREMDELNSYWKIMNPGNFIHHYMARQNDDKIKLLKHHAMRNAARNLFDQPV